ncbi:MAG: galactosyldiacylglycerol synthase [Deinococcota bacterium]|uniref:galactosyldiacylglycerol synthase n=1 Tax=Allomeiothermus silvanus TaxID=52022 RepID=UPI0023739177|nr:galactosyldiacylglycerol synthase [Allomeiothermus silvanus]MCL6568900.1 galactosyldiacylglycerol synthase [Allomeiothermus silvanus]
MPKLYNATTGAELGEITDEQLEFLQDQLEEESAEDQDYYINQETLEYFAEQGADRALMDLLQAALAGRDEIDIRWD